MFSVHIPARLIPLSCLWPESIREISVTFPGKIAWIPGTYSLGESEMCAGRRASL